MLGLPIKAKNGRQIGAPRPGTQDSSWTQADDTPLHLAAARGAVDIVKLLVKAIKDEGTETEKYLDYIQQPNGVGDPESVIARRPSAVPFYLHQ